MKKLKSLIRWSYLILSALMILWISASYVDIIADNHSPNPEHSKYNLFVLMVDNYEGGK